jgi:tetratricopeptide (TPR) repeat protein
MLDICLKKNYLKDNYIDCSFKKAVVETEEFSLKYIYEMAYFLNLELNFAENSDLRLGDYRTALLGFENAIRAKDDHALAYYYASKCYEHTGNLKKAQRYLATAKRIIAEKAFWREYADRFNIAL